MTHELSTGEEVYIMPDQETVVGYNTFYANHGLEYWESITAIDLRTKYGNKEFEIVYNRCPEHLGF